MLKHNLGEYKLKDDHEAETVIDAMPDDKGHEHYHQQTEKFVPQYNKYLGCGGEFVKTQRPNESPSAAPLFELHLVAIERWSQTPLP
jgi:hypothetical protein